MIIKTKKYKLEQKTYLKLAFRNILREQWWVSLIVLGIASGVFFLHSFWFLFLAILGLALYLLFWFVQFYAVTMLDQGKLMFERANYEITSHQLIIQLSAKQGIPISWDQVQRVIQRKNDFVFVLSKAHIMHLPYKIFNNAHEIKFLETILKRKGLLV